MRLTALLSDDSDALIWIEVPTDRGDRRRLSPREGARTKGAATIPSRCGLEGCASAVELGCARERVAVGASVQIAVLMFCGTISFLSCGRSLGRALPGRLLRPESGLGPSWASLCSKAGGRSPVCCDGLSQVLSQTHVRVRSLTFYDIKDLVNQPATPIVRRH